VLAKLEYIRWVEKSLELNYGVLKIVVLLCNWVKVNYSGNSATMKRDKYGFILVNLSKPSSTTCMNLFGKIWTTHKSLGSLGTSSKGQTPRFHTLGSVQG
jgi:hypothetical protein